MPTGTWKNGLKPIPPSRKGIKMSEEQKQKLRNRVFSLEARKKMSIAQTGKIRGPLSDETKAKIGAKNKGKIGWSAGKKRPDIVAATSGEKHWAWIKDRSLVKGRQDRNNPEYKQWRKSVRDRDGWKCKMSNGDCLGKVVAHHILPWRDYPELRYETNNGITLCVFHHPRKRSEETRLSPYFQELVGKAH